MVFFTLSFKKSVSSSSARFAYTFPPRHNVHSCNLPSAAPYMLFVAIISVPPVKDKLALANLSLMNDTHGVAFMPIKSLPSILRLLSHDGHVERFLNPVLPSYAPPIHALISPLHSIFAEASTTKDGVKPTFMHGTGCTSIRPSGISF